MPLSSFYRPFMLATALCISAVSGLAHAQDNFQGEPKATPTVSPASSANDGQMPFDLTADNISYDVSGSLVTALGRPGEQVHISSARGKVWADKIDYDLNANTVTAIGNVKLANPDSTTLVVERLELTGDLQKGALEQLRLSLPALGEIAQAGTAKVSGTTYTLTDVVYSPCKECIGDRKPWSINAEQMTYRKDKNDMTYKNAVVDVYGVPVMYLPWFRHPIGPKEPKNGLLPPQFGSGDNLGQNVTLAGYVFNPAENADYTIRNRLMTDRGAQFMLERRQSTLTTDSDIRGSYLNDTETGKVRSHLKVEAEKDFSATQRIGINGEVASDDTYLTQFYDRLDPYLTSTAYGEDAGQQHYAALSVKHFQDLDPNVRHSETGQVMPHLQLDRWFAPSFGGQVDVNADVLSVYRSSGAESRRFVTGAEYSRPFMMVDGSKLTLGAQARADLYMVDNAANEGNVTRFLPEANAMWEKPYISPEGNHTIAPQVMVALSPRGGNSGDRIPNEDSANYELATSNLFETSRFSGLDRVETGPRIIYGIDNRWGSPDRTDLRVFLGQSFRMYDDMTLPQSGGAATNVSDWVGMVESNPNEWLGLNSRFRLDNATFNLRRVDNSVTVGKYDPRSAYLRMTHSYLTNGPEELYAEYNVPLTDQLAFRGRVRDDLANKVLLEGSGGLVWTRDCYEIEFSVRRSGYEKSDLQPGTDYLVNLRLLTLGSND